MIEDAGGAIHSKTRLESVEDIRRAFAQERTPTVKENIAAAQGPADARPFRPFRRPPMAIVCILDDNGVRVNCSKSRSGAMNRCRVAFPLRA